MNSRSDKINIVLLADCLEDLMGGAERQIYELAKGLDKEVFSVTVASLECVGKAPRHVIENIGCQFVDFRVKRIYGLSGFLQGFRFRKFLRENNIDIVQTYHFSSDIWGAVNARLAGVKLIISNRRDMGFWRKPRHIQAYRLINRWVSKIIVNARAIKNHIIEEEGLKPSRVQVVYNGIDVIKQANSDVKANFRDKYGLAKDDVILMHLANLSPVKGHLFFLKSLAPIIQKFPNIKVFFIGEGPVRKDIECFIDHAQLKQNIILLGKREDARQLLDQADICLLTSESEGLSNALLEYMAAGKPVIATDVGGNRELVDQGETGYLVGKNDDEGLADAILKLVSDASLRSKMGASGLAKLKQHFAMEKMVTAYSKLYRQLCRKDKIKVLHLVSSGGMFGAERVILNLAQYDDYDSIVGAVCNQHNPHLEIIDEAKKLNLQTAVFQSKGRIDFGTIGSLKNFLLDHDVDILHTHNYKSDILGYFASRKAKKRWISTNHVWHGTDRKLKLYELIDAFVLRRARKVVAVSDEIKNELVGKNFKDDHVDVIDNGIDISLYQKNGKVPSLKEGLEIPLDHNVVTIAGRLSPEKSHCVFIAAAEQVLKRAPQTTFLVVGDGPLKDELTADVKKRKLDQNIIFTGIRKDMPDVYAISDIFVNTSSIEGLPMTMLEAMASKTALIVTPVGAVPKVIRHRANGLIVEQGDIETLSKEICALINEPALRKELAANAYNDVCAKFSFQTMASRYKNIYDEIINN